MSFKTAYDITASKDYVLDHSGSLTMVSESNYVILDDELVSPKQVTEVALLNISD